MDDDSKNPPPGFRPIGKLLPTISPSPRAWASTEPPSPRTSATTGSPPAAPKPASTVGTRPGGSGAVAKPIDLHQLLQMDTPETTDKALLASLPPRVASLLVSKNRERVDEVYGFEVQFTGYEFADHLTQVERQAAMYLVEEALQPADARMILGELARLRALTKARAEDASDLEMLAHVYAEEMADYPPDVIRGALRGWSRREKWWPSWAELKALLDAAVFRREALHNALRRA